MRLSSVFRCAFPPIALMLIGGCGDRANPAAPAATMVPRREVAHSSSIASGMIVKRTTNLTSDVSVSATITSQGGWLMIPEAGLLLYFPKGAVESDLSVTATAHNGNKVVYSFEPHGTVFNTPIYVGQLLLNTELNTPRSRKRSTPWGGYMPDGLADVADDGTGQFAEVFAAEFYGKGNDTYAFFMTTHFSGYALASGRRNSGRE
jgi:hypothetical protein